MEFKVLLNEENRRLDSFLRKKFLKTSLSLIYKLIRTHKVKINNVTILDPKTKVKLNDVILVNTNNIQLLSSKDPLIKLNSKEIKLFEIIFENKDILIINKPPFTSVHGFKNCLDNQVKDFLIKRDNLSDIYITHIHRLDKDTTGCIVYAKNLATVKFLQDNFNDIKKVYIFLTSKPFAKKSFIQEGYVSYFNGKAVLSDKNKGKNFRQKIQFCQRINENIFLYKVYLYTGRKHQIRYGCNLLNNPIIGEKIYINKKLKLNDDKYLYLHAYGIVFSSKICEVLNLKTSCFYAQLPNYWDNIFIRNNVKFHKLQLI